MGSRNGIEKVAARKAGVGIEEWLARRQAGELWCYCCQQWRPAAGFGVDRSRANGRASACKTCVSYKATASRYGIPIEDARQLRSGARSCEICGRQRKLEVDHDHETGAVRGLLCGRCNKAIGLFKDSEELMLKAIEYLNKGKEVHCGSEFKD